MSSFSTPQSSMAPTEKTRAIIKVQAFVRGCLTRSHVSEMVELLIAELQGGTDGEQVPTMEQGRKEVEEKKIKPRGPSKVVSQATDSSRKDTTEQDTSKAKVGVVNQTSEPSEIKSKVERKSIEADQSKLKVTAKRNEQSEATKAQVIDHSGKDKIKQPRSKVKDKVVSDQTSESIGTVREPSSEECTATTNSQESSPLAPREDKVAESSGLPTPPSEVKTAAKKTSKVQSTPKRRSLSWSLALRHRNIIADQVNQGNVLNQIGNQPSTPSNTVPSSEAKTAMNGAAKNQLKEKRRSLSWSVAKRHGIIISAQINQSNPLNQIDNHMPLTSNATLAELKLFVPQSKEKKGMREAKHDSQSSVPVSATLTEEQMLAPSSEAKSAVNEAVKPNDQSSTPSNAAPAEEKSHAQPSETKRGMNKQANPDNQSSNPANAKQSEEKQLEQEQAIAPMEPIRITIELQDGNILRVALDPTETIGNIKRAISPVCDILAEKQILRFGGKELTGTNETLEDLNVRDGAILKLAWTENVIAPSNQTLTEVKATQPVEQSPPPSKPILAEAKAPKSEEQVRIPASTDHASRSSEATGVSENVAEPIKHPSSKAVPDSREPSEPVGGSSEQMEGAPTIATCSKPRCPTSPRNEATQAKSSRLEEDETCENAKSGGEWEMLTENQPVANKRDAAELSSTDVPASQVDTMAPSNSGESRVVGQILTKKIAQTDGNDEKEGTSESNGISSDVQPMADGGENEIIHGLQRPSNIPLDESNTTTGLENDGDRLSKDESSKNVSDSSLGTMDGEADTNLGDVNAHNVVDRAAMQQVTSPSTPRRRTSSKLWEKIRGLGFDQLSSNSQVSPSKNLKAAVKQGSVKQAALKFSAPDHGTTPTWGTKGRKDSGVPNDTSKLISPQAGNSEDSNLAVASKSKSESVSVSSIANQFASKGSSNDIKDASHSAALSPDGGKSKNWKKLSAFARRKILLNKSATKIQAIARGRAARKRKSIWVA